MELLHPNLPLVASKTRLECQLIRETVPTFMFGTLAHLQKLEKGEMVEMRKPDHPSRFVDYSPNAFWIASFRSFSIFSSDISS